MSEIWVAESSVVDSMKDLVAKYHPDIVPVVDEIAVVFKEKSSKVGDVDVVGKTAKAAPLLGLLGDTQWKFVITLAADAWINMNDKERQALLDHHLCACGVTEDKDNNLKCFVRIPDVAFFQGEVERHGFWRTTGSAADPDVLQELFGG